MHTHYFPTTCPHCNAGLDQENAVKASFTDGRRKWDRPHRVIAGVVRLVDGPTPEAPPESWSPLDDPAGEIARQLYSEAHCASCGGSLAEVDLLDEIA